MAKANYEEEAKRLSLAIDIAVDSFKMVPPKDFEQKHIDHCVKVYLEWKDDLANGPIQYRNLRSLKYVITSVFTYFQEGSGECVNYFWQQISSQRLGYQRENKLDKIFKRKRIKDDIEYDFVIDVILPYQQEGLIGEKEVDLLNNYLAEYEKKHKQI